MIDPDRRRPLDDCPQGQQVIEVDRPPILYLDPGEDKIVTLVLDVLVGIALGPEQLDAALLEPDQVIRMVHESHAVRLGVADANGGFPGRHRTPRGRRQVAGASRTQPRPRTRSGSARRTYRIR